jgi:uroporphyrinogen-III synthase
LPTLRGLPVYAVGEATAEAASGAGFDVVAIGNGGVEDLLASIELSCRLVHLCGEDRKAPEEARHRITPIVVYRAKTIAAPDLGDLRDFVGLIHSPRAGRRFSELVQDRGSIAIAAISPAAVEAVGKGWEHVDAAPEPTDDALLALAARLCDKPPER